MASSGQPAHASGPEAGPPVTERIGGVLAREVEGVTPLPVLAVRAGPRDGPPPSSTDADRARPADRRPGRPRRLQQRARRLRPRRPRAPERAVQRGQGLAGAADQRPDRDLRPPRPARRLPGGVLRTDAARVRFRGRRRRRRLARHRDGRGAERFAGRLPLRWAAHRAHRAQRRQEPRGPARPGRRRPVLRRRRRPRPRPARRAPAARTSEHPDEGDGDPRPHRTGLPGSRSRR